MKATITQLLAGSLMVCCAAIAQADLVGHWTFDDPIGSTAATDGVNSNDATLTNMDPGSDWVTGTIGGALDFDGTNDEAIISSVSPVNGATAMTVSIWVNPNSLADFTGIFEHRSAGGSNLHGLLVDDSAAQRPQFRVNDSAVTTASALPVDGSWTHLVGTWEAGSFQRLYVDGQLQIESTSGVEAGPLTSDHIWRFGEDACCGGRNLDGRLDDGALWDRALSTIEVAALFNLGEEPLLNYDAGEVNLLLEAFENSQETVTIDGLAWNLVTDGSLAGSPGEVVQVGTGILTSFRLNLGGGNGFTTFVPEPSTVPLLALVLVPLMRGRKRRQEC